MQTFRQGKTFWLVIILMLCLSLASKVYAQSEAPPSTLDVVVPDYEVTTEEEIDHVEIPGGKIATALLIMGIPILDAGWVIMRRIFECKSPFRTSDRKHLHFRLLDSGMTQRKAVLFLYLLCAGFGTCTLFLQSKSKLIALGVLLLVMIVMGVTVVGIYKNKQT